MKYWAASRQFAVHPLEKLSEGKIDAVQRLLNPSTRKEAALQPCYRGVAELLSRPEPIRSAAIETLGYFAGGKGRLVELWRSETSHYAPVAGLQIAKYPHSKLLTHLNRLRKRAIDALKRLAKINNPMGRIAAQKLREIG